MIFDVAITDTGGGTCIQSVSLPVVPLPEPDWTQLDWGHPQVTVVFAGAPVLTLTPATGMSDTFEGRVDYADQFVDDFQLSNTGELIVPGYAANCNMEITIARTLPCTTGGNILMFGLTTFPLWTFNSFTPSGVYNVPFTLLDNGGVPNLVRVRYTMLGFPQPPAIAPTITLGGVITNV